MGKGDKKTKKGKIFMGSYGKTRPHKTERHNFIKPKEAKATKAKTAATA